MRSSGVSPGGLKQIREHCILHCVRSWGVLVGRSKQKLLSVSKQQLTSSTRTRSLPKHGKRHDDLEEKDGPNQNRSSPLERQIRATATFLAKSRELSNARLPCTDN